jgi:hypothetical protein
VQLANAFFGQGTQIFNGGGGVSLINSYSRNKRRVFYQTRNAVGVYVGGRRLPGSQTNRNQWVTAKKIVVWSNKTDPPLFPNWGTKNKTTKARSRRVQLNVDAVAALDLDFPPSLFMVQSSMEDTSKSVLLAAEDFAAGESAGGALGSQAVLKGYHALVGFMQKQQQEQAQGEVGPITASGDTKVSVPDGAECFLCNVAPLPTAGRVAGGQCQTSDVCQGGSAMESIQAAAKEYGKPLPVDPTVAHMFGLDVHGRRLPEAAATASPANLPDSNLVWNELSVYCPTSAATAADTATIAAKCVSDELLKAAVAAYLHPMTGFSVAVAPREVHAAVADVVPDDVKESVAADAAPDMACMTGTRYNVYVTTLDNANVKDLQAAFAAVAKDPSAFLALLAGAKDVAEEAGDKPCGVSLKPMTTVSLPPVDKMPAFQPRGLGMIGPAISVGAADSIVPVTEAVKGDEYTLTLQNFPHAGSAYEVRLMEGLDPVGTVIATVDASEVGRDGVAEVKWTAPAGTAMDGNQRYYLKASLKSFPAFFTVSQPFFIREQATPGRRW